MNQIAKINWEKYFDAIYCINYIGMEKRRIAMSKELARVGILDHKNFMFRDTIRTRWHDLALAALNQCKLARDLKPSGLSLAIGHYFCLTHAIQKKYNSIFILEDDERFLKDLDSIESALASKPNDAEMIYFDKFPWAKTPMDFQKKKDELSVNEYYCQAPIGYELLSAGAYGLYGLGIKKMHDLYDQKWLPPDNYATNAGMKRYFLKKNLACQITYKNSSNVANGIAMNAIHNRYIIDGLNYDDYMMKSDGSKYSFGDCIDG